MIRSSTNGTPRSLLQIQTTPNVATTTATSLEREQPRVAHGDAVPAALQITPPSVDDEIDARR